jgi:acyl-CoA hydrolase
MIAVDEAGKPASVPKLDLVTEDDKRRYNDAIQRREIRMSSRHSK